MVLDIAYHGHFWLFRGMMDIVNEEALKQYLPYRQLFIRFLEDQLGNASLAE